MLFNSLEYACLLVGALALTWLFAERRKVRVIALLVASYLFYASWNAAYLSLIFISSSLDFGIGRLLKRTEKVSSRRLLLATSIVFNLGVLCTFKYFNFFSSEVSSAFSAFGIQVSTPSLDVLLPVGISFYTFQTLSYTIDVYRRRLEPSKSYFEYLLFVSFFPQLVAGPIVRASTLLPQIGKRPGLSAEQGSRAIFRIGLGLVKKIAIADFLGAHLVDPVFSNPEMYSSVETLLAVYGYSFQIYMDFSAYSDIAIGSAALLGFKIPENFKLPYRATDLRDFWQRWHISLSTWLRDYLYISLGGSKMSKPRVYFNLMVTMLLGGLWHGAAATFVFWGALHGAALVVTRIVQRLKIKQRINSKVRYLVSVFLTFNFVCFAWVFFRSTSMENALDIFVSIGDLSFDVANVSFRVLSVLVVAAICHWIPESLLERVKGIFHVAPAPVQAACLVLAILLVQQIARTDVAPFIYFQF